MSKLAYKKVVDKCLDQNTVNSTQLIPSEKWDDPDRRDTEIELNKTHAKKTQAAGESLIRRANRVLLEFRDRADWHQSLKNRCS